MLCSWTERRPQAKVTGYGLIPNGPSPALAALPQLLPHTAPEVFRAPELVSGKVGGVSRTFASSVSLHPHELT